MSINNQNTFLNIEDAHLRLRTGNVYAQGINIGGITVDTAHGLQRVSDTGNVTSNTLQFDNATTAFVTTANVTVGRDLTVTGNATVSSNLTVTGNALISDDLTVTENLLVSNNLTVTENLTVTGNTFYTNPASVLVDSNVVTEYTGPHDRPLRKYPEVALTANDNSSTSGYTIVQSTQSTSSTEARKAWSLFNHVTSGSGGNTYHGDDGLSPTPYNSADGTYDQNESLGGVNGTWLYIRLPKKISLDHVKLISRSAQPQRVPRSATFLGSNNGTDWTSIFSFSDVSLYPSSSGEHSYTYNVNSTVKYEYFGFVWEKIGTNYYVNMEELELYGYEEGSGSLDTTLKSVYNVPATTGTQLEVYYDAKDLTTMPATVSDLSPNSNGGSVTGATLDTTDGIESFKFDGVDDKINTSGNIGLGANPSFSLSFWIYQSQAPGGVLETWFYTGSNTDNGRILIYTSSSELYFDFRNNNVKIPQPSCFTWHNVTMTYSGSGTSRLIYVDGIQQVETGVGTNYGADLTLVDAPIYIGTNNGGTSPFEGSIANFRLYSKALNADQVKELYDYQKDYFLGSKSQVTLYKGHLGVGVTEPSGQLELAGDERIQEYPPRGMTGYETLVEGHGVFCASASSYYNSSYAPWKAFRKVWDTDDNSWASFNNTVTKETGLPSSTAANFKGIPGNWIQLKLPYKIDLHSFKFESRDNVNFAPEELPGTGIVYGSNDEVTWDIVHSFSGVDYGGASGTLRPVFTVKSNTSYSIFRLLVTKNYLTRFSGTSDIRWAGMGAWRLFGTPGPTTLDKGSLSLTRSLDVPRVSRYDVDTETPRPEKLVVDFDTTVNSSPTDISGKGNHGTFNGTNMNYSAADKAFDFDGSFDYIDIPSVSGVGTGAWVHSKSFWFKMKSSDLGVLFLLGRNGNTRQLGVQYNGPAGQFQYYIYGCNARVQVNGSDWLPDLNRWYHCVTVFKNNENVGGNVVLTGREMYIDGVKQTLVSTGTQLDLDLDSSGVRFGNQYNSANVDYQLSNPKLYNVALEPSEVKKLYNLGRTGRSMVISDTAVGIGKVPEAQLDVRGIIKCDGVVRPYTCAFSAYASSGGNSSATGVFPADGVHFDIGNCYDASTYEFTAPVYGIYHMSWSAYTNQAATTTSRIFAYQSNNMVEQKGHTIEKHGNSLSLTVRMQAGETFNFRGSGTYPLYYYGAGGHNRFSGHLICAL